MKMMKLKVLFFLSIALFTPSLEALKPERLYAKMQEPTPEWIMEQIHHDLAPFKKELSRRSLDELFKQEEFCLVRVQIVGGKMTFKKSGWAKVHPVANWIIDLLKVFNSLVRLPDADFVFSCHDEIGCSFKGLPLPVFIISKKWNDYGLILFPDWFAMRGFEPDRSLVIEGNDLYPWESKSPLLFFRGSDSGIKNWSRWLTFPRPVLMDLSLQFPELIDSKFHYIYNEQIIGAEVKKLGYMGNFVSMRDHSRYRYLMDIDGNCAPTPRFPLLMHSNSVILKNTTNSMLWFYRRIKKDEHFIPVAENLSDVLEKLEWAKNHDEECQKISENARQLAAEIFTQETVYLFLYRLLEEYSKKQAQYYYD